MQHHATLSLRRRFLSLLSLLALLLTGWAARAQAPTISSLSPTSGPGGTVVTVTGTNLTNIKSVVLRGIPCNITPSSATQASFVVPAQASTGPVRLSTTSGNVLSSTFTVTRASSSLTYVLRSSSFNSINVSSFSMPAFTDLDHDGLIDMLVGRESGEVSHYEQSAANSTSFTLRSNNLSGVAGHYNSIVSVTDIDGDGLLEMVVGSGGGNFKHYEQTAANSTSFTQLSNDFNNVFSTGGMTFQSPHFTDIDGDGLLDLLVGDEFLSRYEQTAANGGTFTQLNNQNFGPTADASNGGSEICVIDLDGDNLLDILIASNTGQLRHYEQNSANGTAFTQVSSAFNGINVSGYAGPAVTDLDGDGLLDLILGGADGVLRHYEQVGTPSITSFTPTIGPVGTSVTITGTNLDGATAVSVNGTAGSITGTPTATSLAFTVGAGSTTGVVRVTTPGGFDDSSTSFSVTIPAPVVTSVAVPANGTYNIADQLNFSVTFDQAVTVNTAGGTPSIALTVGSTTRQATYVSGTGSTTLVFRYTTVSGDLDTNGVALGSTIVLNGGTIRNASSTNASLTLNGVASTTGVLVDGVAPTVTISSTAGAGGGSTGTSPIPFSVSFSESVTGLVIGDIVVTNGTKSALSGSGPYTFTVTPTGAGAVTVNIAANVATDAAGNGNTIATQFTITYNPPPTVSSFTPGTGPVGTSVTITGTNLSTATAATVNGTAGSITGTPTATSLTFTVGAGSTTGLVRVTTPGGFDDSSTSFTVQPSVTSVNGPADGTYALGQNLDFGVLFDRAVTVNTAGGTPSIALTVGSTTRQATYVSGTGSTTLVFRYTTVSGDLDTNGVVLAGSISLNGGTIRTGSVNAVLTLNDVDSTTGVLVDAVVPTVSITSTAGASGGSTGTSPIPITVTFSEAVTGFTNSDIVVTNGTKASFTAVTALLYTVNITPTGAAPVTITVNIAANAATDGAGNGNTAATAFTLTYRLLPTISSFTPGTGPVGTSVTLTGTYFTGTTAVSFNGTAAASFTVNSATSITATVGSGSTTGLISVTNASGAGSSATSFTVQASVTSVAVPPNATYNTGDQLNFSVVFDRTVTVNTAGGTPTLPLTVGSTARTATYVSGSGSATLVFRYTVPAGDLDTNGVALGSALSLNGGTIRNSTVDATLTLNGVASTAGVLVDGVAPTVSISSAAGASGSTTGSSPIPFTVMFSEPVTGVALADIVVTNGSKSPLSGSGSGPYTFTVTPSGAGLVTVDVAASVATDGAGNGNTAASQFSITYSPAATPTPTVTTPADGSFSADTTPTYSGTAVAGSTVTVYVDGSSIGTTTADASGNWTKTQASALSNAAHTVSATALASGFTLSAASSPHTFTVDGVAPTVAISSAASSPTATSPIPLMATFSEQVSPLGTGQFVVSNGTLSPRGTTGITYAYDLIPTGPGTVTVRLLANEVTDAAGNGNTISNLFSIMYSPPMLPTISNFTPASGAVGTSVTITGTNLSTATAVTVNGTAGSITGTPTATSLSFTVGAGSTTGLLSVTTPSGMASSSTGFTVCQPVAVAQDVTLALDASGAATLLVSQVNNVSQADCGAAPLSALSVSPSTFSCDDIGYNTVTLTVTDSQGNTHDATAQVLVVAPPVATTTWLGRTGTDWTDCENWSYGKLPDAVTNVVIPAGTSTYPVLPNGTLAVQNLTIATGANFTLNSTATLEVNGNWVSDGATTLTGTVRFVGSATTQTVGGSTAPIFTTLVINKASGGVSLGQNIRVNGTLTLTSGALSTTSSYRVTLGGGGTIAETATAYVTGTVETTRILSTAGVTTVFGGLGLRLTPAGPVLPGATTVTRVTGTTLSGVNSSHSIQRYYTIAAATDSGLSATLFFGYEDSELAGFQETDLGLFRSATGLAGPWQPMRYSSRNASSNTVTLNDVDHFSTWTLGSLNAPLPVELLAFNAEAQGRAVALAWRTASEKNSDHWELERSTDGKVFAPIGQLPAQGTKASPTNYSYLDDQITPSLSRSATRYYRLRQVDTDGAFSYSPVRAVRVGGKALLTLYPNPAHGEVQVLGANAGATLEVYDATGSLIITAIAKTNGTARLPLPGGLAPGVYVVKSGSQVQRLMVE